MTPRSEVNGLVGRDWGKGEGKREGGWRTYNYPSQHKFSSNPSVPFLGCQRVFFALLGTTASRLGVPSTQKSPFDKENKEK